MKGIVNAAVAVAVPPATSADVTVSYVFAGAVAIPDVVVIAATIAACIAALVNIFFYRGSSEHSV